MDRIISRVCNRWTAMLAVSAAFFVSVCFQLIHMPKSAAFLSRQYELGGSFQLGTIDFWFGGAEEEDAELKLYVHAPTRYFRAGSSEDDGDPDDNFDATVNVHKVVGHNIGDINLLVDLDCTGVTEEEGAQLYYVIVPAVKMDDFDFSNGPYPSKDYLKTILGLSEAFDLAQRKTRLDEINAAALNQIKTSPISLPYTGGEGASSVTLCYILFWQEYDTAKWMDDPYEYRQLDDFKIKLTANARQEDYT